jgi:tetratricopeptide (TPR) repeat protein
MHARMGCLDDLTITNLVGNALAEPELVAALAHLDDCRSCYELVAALGSPRAATLPRLAPGTTVGHYVVERIAGAGAMGVVYAARDPRLDRAVALKCVAASGDAHAQERMLREAKAMAQLSHRNVVSIFDVGTYGNDVFLAMEWVPGRTLRQWLLEPRSVRDIVGVLADAGRGLAAAHAAGLVHRDIKPDNVLIADDGRVCVTDFGLARELDAAPEPTFVDDVAVDTLTATGQVIGTPAYMAPEQLAGGTADVRSDQFAFCVVAYECFAGHRPFEGRTIAELRTAIARGPQPIAKLPAWIQRVIDRGLAADPAQRFATLDELLAALARDPAKRRRRFAIGAGVIVLAAGAYALVPRAHDACPDPRGRLAGVWDDARRTQLRAAFAARPHPFTAAVLARALTALDRYADGWVELRTDACRATYERRDQSEARYDTELACLERRRGELAATVDLLATAPDEQTVRNAVAVVQGLPDVHPCRDGETLSAQAPLPALPAARAQVDVALRDLATAKALAKTAKYAAAQHVVDELVPRARTLDYAPALAETLYLAGKLQMATSRDAAVAERALNEAATLAATAKDDALAARVWIQLAYTVGTIARRFSEAESLVRVARTAVQRAGNAADLVVDWHNSVGAILVEQGKYDEALPHFKDALALAEPAGSGAHDRLADQLSKLAGVLDAGGHYAEARTTGERAVALTEAEVGPDHPDLAATLDALGAIEYDAGEFAAAQASYRRALAIYDKLGEPATYNTTEAIEGLGNTALALGQLDDARAQHERVLAIREGVSPDDPRVADSLINLGMVLVAQGHVDAARANYDRALALYKKAYGDAHPQVAVALRQRAQLEMGTEAAVTDLDAALAITIAALGPDNPEVGVDHGNLGAAYAGLKRWREAQDHYRLAVANHEKTVGPQHEMTAMALTGLGQAMLERHDAQAIPTLERALAIHAANHAVPAVSGAARLFLAQALWATDRTRARAEAAAAQHELADAKDPTSVQARTELEVWRKLHP